MRGPVGTSIKLTIRRKNIKKPLEFNITRKIIEIKSVESKILGKNKDLALYGFGHFLFKRHLYGYLYPRIVNSSENFKRYTGVPRSISRGGFNSGETDLSGIGFENIKTSDLTKPYFTTKKNGTGLGLSIVSKIINDHNGMMSFFNLDKGAKIEIKFFK